MINRQNYKSLIKTTLVRIKNPIIKWLCDIIIFQAHLFSLVAEGGFPGQQASV